MNPGDTDRTRGARRDRAPCGRRGRRARPHRAHATVLLALALVLATAVVAVADHRRRIVLPYGVSESHYPVVAGFELLPDPLLCGAGTPTGDEVLREEFTLGGWDLRPSMTGHGYPNLWNHTTFEANGTADGHSAGGHLYYGRQETADYDWGRSSGDVASPPLTLDPDEPAFLSFATKWEVEWFNGYDHMWVEARVLSTNQTFILCKLNPPVRPDSSSGPQTTPACSPEDLGPCPDPGESWMEPVLGLLPDGDPVVPQWEHRYVEVPHLLKGEPIELQFSFDSADGVANHFMGWMVDDVVVSDGIDSTRPAFPTGPPGLPGGAGPW